MQKVTEKVIENLPNGNYAIFENNILVDFITIENTHEDGSRSNFPISAILGSDEIYEAKNFIEWYGNKDYYIVLASEVKFQNN
jgi:hypothetical protein